METLKAAINEDYLELDNYLPLVVLFDAEDILEITGGFFSSSVGNGDVFWTLSSLLECLMILRGLRVLPWPPWPPWPPLLLLLAFAEMTEVQVGGQQWTARDCGQGQNKQKTLNFAP